MSAASRIETVEYRDNKTDLLVLDTPVARGPVTAAESIARCSETVATAPRLAGELVAKDNGIPLSWNHTGHSPAPQRQPAWFQARRGLDRSRFASPPSAAPYVLRVAMVQWSCLRLPLTRHGSRNLFSATPLRRAAGAATGVCRSHMAREAATPIADLGASARRNLSEVRFRTDFRPEWGREAATPGLGTRLSVRTLPGRAHTYSPPKPGAGALDRRAGAGALLAAA
jgi:hypothetical protein